MRSRALSWWVCLGLSLVVWLLYARALGFGFVSWDDDQNILTNAWFRDGDWLRFWREPYLGMYVPPIYTVWYALSRVLQPPHPGLFHALNIGMHALNTCLVYHLVRRFVAPPAAPERLWRGYGPAVLAALIFALHPLQVEAVAWVTGLRDLVSTFWILVALRLFLAATSLRTLTAALAAFAVALLCKPAAVILPLVLLILVGITGVRPLRRTLVQLWPWFVLAAAVAFATRLIQTEVTSFAVPVISLGARAVVTLDSLGFYLRKLVLPVGLAVDYGRTPAVALDGDGLAQDLACVAALVLCVVVLLRWRALPRWSWGFLALALCAWLPTSGIVAFAFQHVSTVADHYMYLPLAGVALALAGWFAAGSSWRLWFGVVLVGASAFLTEARLPVWEGDQTLFPAMVAANPRSFAGQIGTAALHMRAGRYSEALPYLKAAELLEPHSVTTLLDKWLAYVQLGRFEEVVADAPGNVLTRAQIAANPSSASTLAAQYVVLAYAQLQTGHLKEGRETFCLASFAEPTNPDVAHLVPFVSQRLGLPPELSVLCP